MPRIDSSLRDRARQLRREPTEADKRLWSILRDRQQDGAHFRRQHPIPPYVADFACVEARLVVEVDGGPQPDQVHAYLERHGWHVLGLSSHEVLTDPEGVANQVAAALRAPTPRPGTAAPALPRATSIAAHGTATATATLAFDDRHRRRLRLATDDGHPFLLDLPEAQILRDGDLLVLDDGRLVLVRAALEAVLDVHAPDPLALARVAWHLGNRHTPTQILQGGLRIRADHVLLHLLTDHLGSVVTPATAPFDPEGGAYGDGHGHEH